MIEAAGVEASVSPELYHYNCYYFQAYNDNNSYFMERDIKVLYMINWLKHNSVEQNMI